MSDEVIGALVEKVEGLGGVLNRMEDAEKWEGSRVSILEDVTKRLLKTQVELQSSLSALQARVDERDTQVDIVDKMCKSLINYTKEVDLRIDALLKVFTDKDLITEEDHSNAFDDIRGLRRKSPDESIVNGDVAWVTFEADMPNGKKHTETDFPVRVGAGALLFEGALIGKHPGEGFTTEVTLPGDYSFQEIAGKSVTFVVKIGKVKAKV